MKRYLPATLLGLILCLGLALSQGLFKGQSPRESFRILSDGFFLAGVVVGGFGLMAWISGMGQFTGLRYAMHLAWGMLRPGIHRAKTLNYQEFREQHPEKGVEARYLLIPGAVFMLLAALFLLLYHRVTAA